MSSRFALKLFFSALLIGLHLISHVTLAQLPVATVRGLVADPDAAVIPGATVTLTPASGKALITTSASDGTYVLRGVPAGTYSITVTMSGFASFVRQGVRISGGQTLNVDIKLIIQTQQQEVQVTAQSAQVSVDADSNASSTTIKGADLDALSDDPDELSSELSALAGPSAGPNGGQIYVDGFTGGQLPPKSSIREIRINQNPFSAQYDRLGYGRVEVFTKPGTDKFHGSFQTNGNHSSFNTGNPFISSQPAYHTLFILGNITGPINSKASFTLSGSHRNIQDNTVVNGTILANPVTPTLLCPPGNTAGCVITPYSVGIAFPQVRTDISPRLDLALGERNTLTTRFQYERNDHTNNGVGGFDLPSTGYNDSSSEAEIQISDTQIVNSHIINETRFEVQRNRDSRTAQDLSPALNVQGSFTGGGTASGSDSVRGIHVEGQNYTSIQLEKNFFRLGGRLRYNRSAQRTSSGTNGTFTYNCLVTLNCKPGGGGAVSSYENGVASQFSQTVVRSAVSASVVDVGLYAEDDWKPRPNLTLSYGLRYEAQNVIGDSHDIAPRISFAYGLGSTKRAPKTVLRGGFGMFYDRFNIGSVLVPIQGNGFNQVRTTIKNPGPACTPTSIANCSSSLTGNTTTVLSPGLRTPYTMQFALGVDQQLFRGATLSINYLNARGVHQYLSENINAPVNGVYPITPGPGIQPPVIFQYQSAGVFRQNQIITNFNVRSGKYVSLFGYYVINFAKSDTSGFSSYPSVPYNIGADYGRATFDTRNRLFLGGSITAPYRITVSPLIVAQSGSPYNVTLGTDNNNDSIYNDRPYYKSGQTANCQDSNSFGAPTAPGQLYTPIPINYCTGPALFTANLRVGKTFGFGPSTGARAQGGAPGPGGPGPGGLGGRGGPGGRGGAGGGFGGGGASTGKRYNVTLAAQFQNIFNTIDYSPPVGNLNSPNFGRSLQLAGNIYSSNSAVRRIFLQAGFSF